MEWRDLLERPYQGCRLPRQGGFESCPNLAECLFNGWPACLDCADFVLERLSLPPSFRRTLPALSDR